MVMRNGPTSKGSNNKGRFPPKRKKPSLLPNMVTYGDISQGDKSQEEYFRQKYHPTKLYPSVEQTTGYDLYGRQPIGSSSRFPYASTLGGPGYAEGDEAQYGRFGQTTPPTRKPIDRTYVDDPTGTMNDFGPYGVHQPMTPSRLGYAPPSGEWNRYSLDDPTGADSANALHQLAANNRSDKPLIPQSLQSLLDYVISLGGIGADMPREPQRGASYAIGSYPNYTEQYPSHTELYPRDPSLPRYMNPEKDVIDFIRQAFGDIQPPVGRDWQSSRPSDPRYWEYQGR